MSANPRPTPRPPSAPRRTFVSATAPLLRGTVIDLAGEPVAGAVVGTSAPPHADGAPFTGVWYSRNVVTDASGVFGFELIEKRPRECVIAEHPNYIQLAGRVTLDLAPGTNAVEVEARHPQYLSLHVAIGDEPEVVSVPVFLPYAAYGAWTQARATDGGYDAGAVARGRYLVALVPADDGASGPVALLPAIDVEGFGEARLDFRFPATELRGRVVLDGAREELAVAGLADETLAVVALPRVPPGFARELLASSKLQRALRQLVAADGTFTLRYVPNGPHRLLLLAGDEQLAEREVEVAGSAVFEKWQLASER